MRLIAALAAATLLTATLTVALKPGVAGPAWGNAQGIAGLDQINAQGYAQLTVVSCASPGNCGAGGFYTDLAGASEPFVVTEQSGTWGPAVPVRGPGGNGAITAISCAGQGDCTAGGWSSDLAFVVSEVSGSWGAAEQIPGTAGPISAVSSVSCTAPGDCVAGGDYSAFNGVQAYVADQIGGTWHSAQQLPGLAALDNGGASGVGALSCTALGKCAAGGTYTAGSASGSPEAAFVAAESGGTWESAVPLPGTPDSLIAPGSQITSLSCASTGNCAVGGDFSGLPATSYSQPLVADETQGSWGTAQEVPGTASLNAGSNATITSLSCASPGNCGAVGYYAPSAVHSADQQPFVVTETAGVWGSAQQVAGIGALNVSGASQLLSVSCSAPGDCSAGGYYSDANNIQQAFFVGETNGTWGSAQAVPGMASLNGGNAAVTGVACTVAGDCSAVGFYQRTSDYSMDGFVVGGGPRLVTTTTTAVSAPNVVYGAEQAERVAVKVSSGTAETPAGLVTETSGSTLICKMPLVSGAGSCTVGKIALGAGPAVLAVSYAGNFLMRPSASTARFTVGKATSGTGLTLSTGKVRYGNEQRERIKVSVAPQYAGTPTGDVAVKAGAVTVCTIRLVAGTGSCRLTARKLPVGRYHLVARFRGDANFDGSASKSKTLTVVRQ